MVHRVGTKKYRPGDHLSQGGIFQNKAELLVNRFLQFSLGLYHRIQNALQSHRVAAQTTLEEEQALARPVSILIADMVGIMITLEGHGKRLKGDAIRFFSIPFGLLNLADHARIHDLPPLGEKKGTRANTSPGAPENDERWSRTFKPSPPRVVNSIYLEYTPVAQACQCMREVEDAWLPRFLFCVPICPAARPASRLAQAGRSLRYITVEWCFETVIQIDADFCYYCSR